MQNHMLATYASLRIGVAVIAILFPPLLWLGGIYLGMPLQDSMSAYYHATCDLGSMRNWFVGLLFAVGIILHLYRGFSRQENIALNIAGILAVGIAIFPMQWACGEVCGMLCHAEHKGISLHGVVAISFFICIAYVCIFRASDTLHLMDDKVRERRYRLIYRQLGIGMILSPVIAILLAYLVKQENSYRFFAEAAGIWIFAAYWLLKSREISITNAERLAVSKEIQI